MIGSVISTAVDLISGFFKVAMFGVFISPSIIILYFFIQAMQPRTYQLSSLEKIANSFTNAKALKKSSKVPMRKQ